MKYTSLTIVLLVVKCFFIILIPQFSESLNSVQ